MFHRDFADNIYILPNKKICYQFKNGYFQSETFIYELSSMLRNSSEIEEKIIESNPESIPLLLDKKLVFDVYKNEKTKLKAQINRMNKKLNNLSKGSTNNLNFDQPSLEYCRRKLIYKIDEKITIANKLDYIQNMIFKCLATPIKDFSKGKKKYLHRVNGHWSKPGHIANRIVPFSYGPRYSRHKRMFFPFAKNNFQGRNPTYNNYYG